jgi:hypothetical protein
MRRSFKVLLIVLLALQSFAYAGPVCGNHVSTMESMDCCKTGHDQMGTAAAGDSHAEDCCSTCDMGKASSVKAQKQEPAVANTLVSLISFDIPASESDLRQQDWEHQQFHSYSPPEIFLLNDTFRI